MARMLVTALLAGVLFARSAGAQTATQMREVRRIFLSFPSAKAGLKPVAAGLTQELDKSGTVTVVSSLADADAVLAADGDVYVKGFVSLNPRSGISTANGQPVRGGYLSVELKGKGAETLWSTLATPRFGSTRIERDLSRQVSKELLAAIGNARATSGSNQGPKP